MQGSAMSSAPDADGAATDAAAAVRRERKAAVQADLVAAKAELVRIDAELAERRRRERRVWEDEEPALDAYATAMAQTADVMRGELAKLREKTHAAMRATGHVPGGGADVGSDDTAIAGLQEEIARLRGSVQNLDKQLAECRLHVAQATQLEDKALWETQLVALQDTKNLVQSELASLADALASKKRAAAYLHHKQTGQAQISQLQDELATTVGKADRTKQLLYFPDIDGYRFRAGSGGIFLGSKDLFISELAASCYVSCRREIGDDGRAKASVVLRIGGEPPRMSFSAHKPHAPTAPSAFTSPSRRAAASDDGKRASDTSASSSNKRASEGTFAVNAADLMAGGSAAPSYMVPSDAPRQGVWYDGNPFEKKGGGARGVAEGDESDDGESHSGFSPRPEVATGASNGEAAGASTPISPAQTGAPSQAADASTTGHERVITPASPAASPKSSPLGARRVAAEPRATAANDGSAPTRDALLERQPPPIATQSTAAVPGRSVGGAQSVSMGRRHAAASHMAATIAGTGSKGKKAAVGFLNKLSQTKKFGAKGTSNPSSPVSAHSAGSPTPSSPAAPAQDNGMRSSVISKMRAPDSRQAEASAKFKARLANVSTASKKGMSNMGAFMKHTGTKAQAVVDKRMAKLRQQSPHGSDAPDSPFRLYDAHDSIQGTSEPLAELASVATSKGGEAATDAGKASEDDGTASGASPLFASASLGTAGGAPLATAASGEGLPETPPAANGRRRSLGRRPSMAEQHVRLGDAGLGAATRSGLGGDGQSERKGVFVRLQAANVKIVGEKGTKVPNLKIREFSVVLECLLEAQFEWTHLDGWRPASKLRLEIIQLEHSISGTSVPVPKTLLKYLLNMLLPALIEARLLAVLPAEVGQYFVAQGTPGLQFGGKLKVAGQPLGPLNADLAAPEVFGAAKGRKAMQAAADVATARSMVGLSARQCAVLHELLCSKTSCVLAERLDTLTISNVCELLSPLAQHADLLRRWKASLHVAAARLCGWHALPEFDWAEVTTRVLEPSVQKPLRVRFVVTCLDLSCNVDSVVAAFHDYCTRAAHAEAARVPNGAATLQQQLDALDQLNAWISTKLRSFQRRFKHGRASVLASLDAAAVKAFLEDVVYQGPVHAEVPFGGKGTQQSDGSLAFALALPATLANRRSALRDALRTLLGDTHGADEAYLARSVRATRPARGGRAKGIKGGGKGSDSGEGQGGAREHDIARDAAEAAAKGVSPHELLPNGPDIVATKGDKISLGTVQVNALSFKMVLEEDLLQRMLGGAIAGPITADSLARVMQCFGPCLQVSAGSSALLAHLDDLSVSERRAGLEVRTGEICNAMLTAASVGYVSSVPPVRMLRLLHTLLLSFALRDAAAPTERSAKIDRLLYSLARYVGSDALDLTASLQLGLTKAESGLVAQLQGHTPAGDDGVQACCVSFVNDVDMAAVLDSIDISQGTPNVG